MPTIRLLTVCLFALALSPFVAPAQVKKGKIPPASAAVEELLAKHLKARGGLENLQALQTLRLTGKLTAPGVDMPFVIHQKRPNMMLMEMVYQGQKVVQGYDGATAWWVMPQMGALTPRPAPADVAKDLIEQSDFDGPLVDYRQKGNRVEYVGSVQEGERELYRLRVTLPNSETRIHYLDGETFLEIKQTFLREVTGRRREVEIHLSDYRPVAGVMLAHSIETRIGGATASNLVTEKAEPNVEIDDDIFRLKRR